MDREENELRRSLSRPCSIPGSRSFPDSARFGSRCITTPAPSYLCRSPRPANPYPRIPSEAVLPDSGKSDKVRTLRGAGRDSEPPRAFSRRLGGVSIPEDSMAWQGGRHGGQRPGQFPRCRSGADASRLSGLRVALVHDWLTGMRGGEKCLEVLCRAFPDATLHTLIHRRGRSARRSRRWRSGRRRCSACPGVFRHYRHLLPLMPLAAAGVAAGRGRPGRQPEPLRRQGGPGAARACRTSATASRRCATPGKGATPTSTAGSSGPVRRALAGRCSTGSATGTARRAARVTHFVAISETVRRADRALLRPREPGHPAAGRHRLLHARPTGAARGLLPVRLGAGPVQADRARGARPARARAGRWSSSARGRSGRGCERLAGPSVRFLGWQPDEVIRDHYRRCRALLFPGEEDFGIVPVEALACGAPGDRPGPGRRGRDGRRRASAGRTTTPTAEGLLEAIEAWEADGCPHDPIAGRRRAEASRAAGLPRAAARLPRRGRRPTRSGATASPPPRTWPPSGLGARRAGSTGGTAFGIRVGSRRTMPASL